VALTACQFPPITSCAAWPLPMWHAHSVTLFFLDANQSTPTFRACRHRPVFMYHATHSKLNDRHFVEMLAELVYVVGADSCSGLERGIYHSDSHIRNSRSTSFTSFRSLCPAWMFIWNISPSRLSKILVAIWQRERLFWYFLYVLSSIAAPRYLRQFKTMLTLF